MSQLNQRCTSAALIGWSGQKTRDVRVVSQESGYRASQRAGSVTVNDPDLTQTRQRGFVEKLINGIDCFISRSTDDVQLRLGLVSGVC